MYTATHHLLSLVLARIYDRLPGDAYYFQAGAVRPDRGRGSLFFRQHGGLAKCRSEALEELMNALVSCPACATCLSHQAGVSMHYVEDALDRSKRAAEKEKIYIRDVQHALCIALFAHLYLGCAGGTPGIMPGPVAIFEKLRSLARPVQDELAAMAQFNRPTYLFLGFHSRPRLSPLQVNKEKSFKVKLRDFRKFFSDKAPLIDYIEGRLFSELVGRIQSSERSATEDIAKKGFRHALRPVSNRIFNRGKKRRYFHGDPGEQVPDHLKKKIVDDCLDDFGIIAAYGLKILNTCTF